jgi:hypothetical protein
MHRGAVLAIAGFVLSALSCGGAVAPDAPCVTDGGTTLPTADPSARVDLAEPVFSDPTAVTNPLFPIGSLSRAVLLGTVDGVPLRVETTLLPYTRTIDWEDAQVEVLVSQYVAWLGGRIHEVALDWYAQGDDGAVWYFGEDVLNYEDGVITDTDGTWLAERDGPSAMIMPASPRVGDVYRPENICGLVFEEVTVKQVGVTVNGPRGPVQGGILVDELHTDGLREDKIFAPGYGEFSTGSGANLEALAVAVPPDALTGPAPAELARLWNGATDAFEAAGAGDWAAATAAADGVSAAWDAFRGAGPVPPMLEARMSGERDALVQAVAARNAAATRQGAINAARTTLDFELRHRSVSEVDLRHVELWARQLLVDAEAGDQAAVMSDIASLKWLRERFAQDAVEGLALRAIDAALTVQARATRADFAAVSSAASRLWLDLGVYHSTR